MATPTQFASSKEDAFAVGYGATNPTDWRNVPVDVRGALDEIAEHGAHITVSATEPTHAKLGELWYNPSGAVGAGILTGTVITADITLTDQHLVVYCDCTIASLTVTFPAIAVNAGRRYYIKKIDPTANTVTIKGDGTERVEEELEVVMTDQGEALTLHATATAFSDWNIL